MKAIDDGGRASASSIDIEVTDGGGTACTNTGTILREVWTGIPYPDVASIPLNTPPDGAMELDAFEDLTNSGDNYGTRISGYLCVPATGAYTFWISSNDHSELWLSTDDNPANSRKIAEVTRFTDVRQWDKFDTQQSTPIDLIQGQRYYIEALHKEGVGSDHMAVGWQLPDGTLERPIPGSRLSPFESQNMAMATLAAGATDTGTVGDGMTDIMSGELVIYPNPAPSDVAMLHITSGNAAGRSQGTIEIMRMTGEMVYAKPFICPGNCGDHEVAVDKKLTPGVYMVKMTANGKTTVRRLLVR